MKGQPETIDEVRRWVEKAEHDLLAARHDMHLATRGLTDIVCFHCQQCGEKYLKALLVFKGITFPKTHDLLVLRELASSSSNLRLSVSNVIPLNRYSIEGRYPGDWDPIQPKEAKAATTMARGILSAVRKLLPKNALREKRK